MVGWCHHLPALENNYLFFLSSRDHNFVRQWDNGLIVRVKLFISIASIITSAAVIL